MTSDETNAIRLRLKEVIIRELFLEGLTPDQIGDEQDLFGVELGLDSMDALQLVLGMEKEFELKIQNDEVKREQFASVAALAGFIQERLELEQAGQSGD
jgi:acyl carrier protein